MRRQSGEISCVERDVKALESSEGEVHVVLEVVLAFGEREVLEALDESLVAMVCSSRDRPAPGQCVSPIENARCLWPFSRLMSTSAGHSNWVASRLAAA